MLKQYQRQNLVFPIIGINLWCGYILNNITMNNQKLNDFKEVLRLGMIGNFENDGFLIPIVFFLKGNQPVFSQIPPEMLSTDGGKTLLASIIRRECQEPNVFAAGIIIEASAALMDENDEIAKKVLNGEMSISEMKDKQHVIMLFFSTPEEEESIVYKVDCENKKVGELLFNGDLTKQMSGRFTDLFKWNKN
jgi:hypothetical protein